MFKILEGSEGDVLGVEVIGGYVKKDIEELSGIDKNKLIEKRYDRFRKIGVFEDKKSE